MSLRSAVPVMKPLLPAAGQLLPYLERIDAGRWYSNLGPLARAFEQKLARHFAVAPEQVTTSANGTLALVQALWALGVKRGSLCVMPAWTFVATPAAARVAGLVPCFIDIDPASWAITPDGVRALIAQGREVGAVIPVAPFGAPLDLAAWETFAAETGVAVVIDAAAGFDSFAGVRTSLPFMVSLHATKVFGVGEGAVVVAQDIELAKAIRRAGNFGFQGSREALTPAFNAKLSEYAAAVGLAGLDQWSETRSRWQTLTEAFATRLAALPQVRPAPGFGGPWISSYGVVELPQDSEADAVAKAMAAHGVETLAWWGRGCHTHAAYRDCPASSLERTDGLARRVLGLPFWLGLPDVELDRVFERLAEAVEGGPAA